MKLIRFRPSYYAHSSFLSRRINTYKHHLGYVFGHFYFPLVFIVFLILKKILSQIFPKVSLKFQHDRNSQTLLFVTSENVAEIFVRDCRPPCHTSSLCTVRIHCFRTVENKKSRMK